MGRDKNVNTAVSYGMWRRIVLLKFTDVSEAATASILAVEELAKQATVRASETSVDVYQTICCHIAVLLIVIAVTTSTVST
jgi:hypothetical protein